MNKFMKAAIKEAEKGIFNHEGGPFGAVVVKDGKIVAKGHNEVLKAGDPTCHGEIMAIRKATKKLKTIDLSGCELYTTGEPCPMCLGAILWAHIDKVYYGCNVKDTEEFIFGKLKGFFYKAHFSHGHKNVIFQSSPIRILQIQVKPFLKGINLNCKINDLAHFIIA